jgi:hypothetical protein
MSRRSTPVNPENLTDLQRNAVEKENIRIRVFNDPSTGGK